VCSAVILLNTTHWLLVFLFSLTPTIEGRYAIAYGIGVGLNPFFVFILASVTIIMLAFALGFLISYIDMVMMSLKDSRYRTLRTLYRIYDRYLLRIRRRTKPYIEKYGLLGLIVLVAVPLPGTGVWTGALVSYIFGIDRWRTVLGLTIGGLFSNVIVFTLAYFFKIII